MALVAACHETGGDSDELSALRWLERQNPPDIMASDCDRRETVTVYVPPNDFTAPDPNVLPQWRTKRQPRTFPRVRPHNEVVYFVWRVEPHAQHLEVLQRLCRSITRLGHSSSLVQVWLEDAPVEVDAHNRYRAAGRGRLRLRQVSAGAVDYLSGCHRQTDIEDHFRLDVEIASTRGEAKSRALAAYEQRFSRPWRKNSPPERLRPEMSATVAYEQVGAGLTVRGSCFDPALVVLGLSPKENRFRRLAAATSPRVCDVVRKALIKHAPDGLEVVSGHAADGSPLQATHLAVMPLPYVGGPHADGHLLGVAAVLPAQERISRTDRAEALKAIFKVEQDGLTLGDLGVWQLWAVPLDEQRTTLQSDTWTSASRPAKCWATVTPISLDRHPKAKDPVEQQDELAQLIRQACAAIDLPEPVRVVPYPISAFNGAPGGGRYPRLARKDGSNRRQTHALLWFDEPVVGPVLLGAGRFRGWGVCRPYEGELT